MLTIITRLVYFITFILSFFLLNKAEAKYKIKEVKSVSFILEVGAFFDILILITSIHTSAKSMGFLYSFIFPLCILFEQKLSAYKNYLILNFILIGAALFYWQFNVIFIKKHFLFFFYLFLLIQITAISFNIYKTFKYIIKLKASNYFYHLILGLLVLDLFFFFGYYKIIDFEISVWMLFLTFYLIYLNILRVSYIFYVAKNL